MPTTRRTHQPILHGILYAPVWDCSSQTGSAVHISQTLSVLLPPILTVPRTVDHTWKFLGLSFKKSLIRHLMRTLGKSETIQHSPFIQKLIFCFWAPLWAEVTLRMFFLVGTRCIVLLGNRMTNWHCFESSETSEMVVSSKNDVELIVLIRYAVPNYTCPNSLQNNE